MIAMMPPPIAAAAMGNAVAGAMPAEELEELEEPEPDPVVVAR